MYQENVFDFSHFPVLTTERLSLRRVLLSDAADVLVFRGDATARYMTARAMDCWLENGGVEACVTLLGEHNMNGEREKILAMLEEGTITAEEADDLLGAIEETDETERSDFSWPDMPARGQAWRKPFNVALLGSIAGSVLLLGTRKSGGLLRFVHNFILWPLTLFSAAAALITYFTKDSPWLHVRVNSKDGTEFTVSLPFPASTLDKALDMVREQVPDDETKEKLDAAAEMLAEMNSGDLRNPLVIDISDEGDSVQVYLN
jgi:hypothetical protein